MICIQDTLAQNPKFLTDNQHGSSAQLRYTDSQPEAAQYYAQEKLILFGFILGIMLRFLVPQSWPSFTSTSVNNNIHHIHLVYLQSIIIIVLNMLNMYKCTSLPMPACHAKLNEDKYTCFINTFNQQYLTIFM